MKKKTPNKPVESDSDSSFDADEPKTIEEQEDVDSSVENELPTTSNAKKTTTSKSTKANTNEDSDSSEDEDADMGEDEDEDGSKNKSTQGENNESDKGSDGDDDNNDDDGDEKSDDEDAEPEVRMPVINPLAFMKNKDQRMALFKKMKKEKHKQKMQERRARRKAGLPANPGHTIESLREKDQTTVANLNDSDNEELRRELQMDDFSSYFERSYEPKVLITFADNPVTKTRKFGLELSRIFPNALVKIRNRSSVKNICKSAIREEYTDVVIVNEDRRKPNGLLVIHLPNGPTAHFKLSNVQLTSDIKRDHKEITKHRPEVILTNFTTRLGLTVGRMLGALFHHDPEFKGRRAVTFHNQRDYIFFRHHRYEFTKEGKRVNLREMGPRFTLKLRSLQEGLFDSKTGDYSWIITNKRHAMEASRRRFFL
ncbi:PREDICTED: probable ribosome production factor 1 [Bactrocera latifrons]|uniref:Putative ribosome production factor 1 n=1 Tax=Bactrocera latifrons TaxID=174628 RepID=A0A0K8VYJ9_BACLA|nr:PREDICTED: probable ribosome production factor 1 [Bactrocera latifrons]